MPDHAAQDGEVLLMYMVKQDSRMCIVLKKSMAWSNWTGRTCCLSVISDGHRYLSNAPSLHIMHKLVMSEAQLLVMLQQVFDRLEQPDAVDMSSDKQLMSYLCNVMLHPAHCVASDLGHHLAARQVILQVW